MAALAIRLLDSDRISFLSQKARVLGMVLVN
jgi:hypothetical protein